MFEIYMNLVHYAEPVEDREWTINGHNIRRRVFKEETGVETVVLLKDGKIVYIIDRKDDLYEILR